MAGNSSRVRISTSGASGSRSRAWPKRLHHATRNPNVAAAAASQAFDDWKLTCPLPMPSASMASRYNLGRGLVQPQFVDGEDFVQHSTDPRAFHGRLEHHRRAVRQDRGPKAGLLESAQHPRNLGIAVEVQVGVEQVLRAMLRHRPRGHRGRSRGHPPLPARNPRNGREWCAATCIRAAWPASNPTTASALPPSLARCFPTAECTSNSVP